MKVITKEFLKDLYKTSSIPVIETRNMREFMKSMCTKVDYVTSGIYIFPSNKRKYKYKKGVIGIRKNIPNYIKASIFFHEFQHHKCHSKMCSCFMSGKEDKQEEHAFTSCLKECIKLDNGLVLLYSLFSIAMNYLDYIYFVKHEQDTCDDMIYEESVLTYSLAAKNCFKSKIWKEAVEIVRKKKLLNYKFTSRYDNVHTIKKILSIIKDNINHY